MRPILPILVVALSLATVPAAAEDESAARALAEEGKSLVDKGDDANGCPKLAEAWRIDGQLLGAGFALAGCHERQGKLASAWSVYAGVAGKARIRGEARAEEAQKKADALKPRLSTLTIVVPSEIAVLPGLVVTKDRQIVGAPTFGTPVPLDGGKYAIAAIATDRREWKTTADVPNEGGKVTVQIGEPPREAVLLPPPPPPMPAPGRHPFVIPAIALGGIGAATIGISVGLGAQANAAYRAAAGCVGDVCVPGGAQERRDALTVADAATATFVVGALVGATGIVLGVLAAVTPPPRRSSGRRFPLWAEGKF